MTENTLRVLIIDDEPAIRKLLKISMQAYGYELGEAATGQDGLLMAASFRPDIILVDLGLPDMDGKAVVKALREWSETPIIVLTAREQEQEKIAALDVGADDYVTKPFSMPILLEKIRAVLRRSAGAEPDNRLRYRDLAIDPDTREAVLDGRVLDLTTREFDLLYTFLHTPGRVFTREMLLARLWGYDFYGDERVVDSHIKNLRHKLGRNYIETVRGVGYRAAKPDP